MTVPFLYFLSTLWTLVAVMAAQYCTGVEPAYWLSMLALGHWLATIGTTMVKHLNEPSKRFEHARVIEMLRGRP